MAKKKFNEFTAASTIQNSDIFLMDNSSGTGTKKAAAQLLAEYVRGTIPAPDTTLAQSGKAADAAATGAEIADGKAETAKTLGIAEAGGYTFTAADMAQGVWSYTKAAASTTRIRSANLLPVKAGMVVTYVNPTQRVYFGVGTTPNSNSSAGFVTSNWKAAGTGGSYTIPQDGYLTINVRTDPDGSAITPEDYACTVTVKTVPEAQIDEIEKKVLSFYSVSGASFGIADMPVNSFTYANLANITFTDKPDGISSSTNIMVKREQMNSYGNLSLVTVYDAINEITFRATYRSGDGYLFPWKKILTGDDAQVLSLPHLNLRTCNIFKRVLCVGDSYTAGFINLSETGNTDAGRGTFKAYSWPTYMEQITGNEWINCGVSGATSKTWMESADGLTAAQAAGKVQAYIIQLMINDASVEMPVGSTGNIGDEPPTTFYGYYSKIIRVLHAICHDGENPDPKIFVCTCPYLSDKPAYQQAVRDIAERYASTYNVHLLDMKADQALFQNASLTGDRKNNHQTAIGYEQFAEIYAYYISNYINTHISDFQNVHKIPYGTTTA